jgi:hypothetical protein
MSQLIEDMLYYSKNVRDNEGRQLINIVIVDEVLKLLIPQEDVQIKSKLESHYSISACSFYQIVSNIYQMQLSIMIKRF